MRMVAREETFGPVAPLFRFRPRPRRSRSRTTPSSASRVLLRARSRPRLARAEALEYGIVGVNTGIISTEVAPFGGVKESGSAAKAPSTASTTTSNRRHP
jgi:succinate-semialdehyde dehydrogenase/glutarate-semialdehyde dehydrogenase